MKLIRLVLVVTLFTALAAAPCRAEVTVSPLFTDNAVLQRDLPIPVWGQAAAGETVRVTFNGKVHETVADDAGHWQVILAPLPANICGPLAIMGRNTITLTNVITGDVWLCSGQSNMGFRVRESFNASNDIAAADLPGIRHLAVPNKPATNPQPDTFLRGVVWQPASPRTAGEFTATGFFFAREVHRRTGVPIGLINSSWGGTPIQPWTPLKQLETWAGYAKYVERKRAEIAAWPEREKQIKADIENWTTRTAADRAAGKPVPPRPWNPGPPDSGHYLPAQLYNGMIHPLTRYRLRGMLWYQGEANAGGGEGGAADYVALQSRLMAGWRAAFGQGDVPFYFVQLPNWANPGDATRQNWAFFREAQAKLRQQPNTDMAVTIDIGESDDIHPRNKQEAGRRLAQLALARTYGLNVTAHGPEFAAATVSAATVRVRFTNPNGGLQARGALTGFELAGADNKFLPADATLDGDAVVLRAAQVPKPVAVRYAWANDPRASLFDAAGLPAAPFRATIKGD